MKWLHFRWSHLALVKGNVWVRHWLGCPTIGLLLQSFKTSKWSKLIPMMSCPLKNTVDLLIPFLLMFDLCQENCNNKHTHTRYLTHLQNQIKVLDCLFVGI